MKSNFSSYIQSYGYPVDSDSYSDSTSSANIATSFNGANSICYGDIQQLTINDNSVIVVRCDETYDFDELKAIQDYFQNCLPEFRVIVMPKTMDLLILNNDTYTENYYG